MKNKRIMEIKQMYSWQLKIIITQANHIKLVVSGMKRQIS